MRKKILVVEDHQEIRRLIRMTLEFEDYDIVESATASEGLDVARSLHPDLLLLDVMTPGALDGLELCRIVRQDAEDLAAVRPSIIMLTARGQRQDVDAGMAAGADAYLIKPFSPIQLLETVNGILERG